MKLQESPFRGIDVIYLRNTVHEAQIQETMKENWIRDEKQRFSYSLDIPESSTVSAQGICLKYMILLGVKYCLFYVPDVKNNNKL